MNVFFGFLSLLLLLSSCALQPKQLEPFAGSALRPSQQTELIKKCAAVYPQGKYQFVHAIEFSMAGGGGSTVVGVTVVDSNSLSCALMTIEGFTLFQARLGKKLEVDRAVPPFDRPGFAQGLMADVRALFLRPSGQVFYGRLANGTRSCRWTTADGKVTDVQPLENGCYQIRTYDAAGLLTRTITTRSCRKTGSVMIPQELELTVPGTSGYTLKMTLISVDGLTADMLEMIRLILLTPQANSFGYLEGLRSSGRVCRLHI